LRIGISHAELDNLTLVELNERIAGFNERENETWQRHCHLTSYILAALTGKKIKAQELMPWIFPIPPVLSKEDRLKELREIREAVGLN